LRKFVTTLVIAASLVSAPYIANATKVVIDPGHGGNDPGAIGINGLYEKKVNNAISYRLKDLLLQNGYEVVMTRDTDKTLSLSERVEIARNADADLFVSIHSNSHTNSSIQGTMVLYHDAAYPNPNYPASEEMKALTPESRRLGQLVLSSVLKEVPNVDRGVVPSSVYVVRNGNIPSILVETAFLSNPKDAEKLASTAIQEKYAVGILNGIKSFLPPTFSDIGGHWAKESIIRLNAQGIANGNQGKFYPDQPLTRAELVAFADRAFGLTKSGKNVSITEADTEVSVTQDVYEEDTPPSGEDVSGIPEADIAFPDLTKDHWAYETIRVAVRNGVLRGYPDGSIRPDAPVSRAEVAVVLDRLISPIPHNWEQPVTFKDVTTDNWAYSSIIRLSNSGIVRGIEPNIYAPEKSVTRAEMATMVDRQLSSV